MSEHEKIDYLEFPSKNLNTSKAFFSQVFNWKFTDFGPEYSAFEGAGIMGGFYQSDLICQTANGSVLTVFYSSNIEQTQNKIIAAGGKISVDIFSFPGGVRFHFLDPNGNEYAVWSESEQQLA
jgi:predicted enzyme related to lactoylglutathione lyase